VAKLLNDLFGIQARAGCACAGPYGHALLGVGEELSLRIRAAIVQVITCFFFQKRYHVLLRKT
jgi:selenocysteine lyase/cysteine desulfurase